MNRRKFLTLAGVTAGMGAAPGPFGNPSGQGQTPEAEDPVALARGRARALGKPLLIGWLGGKETKPYGRHTAWGRFFRRASDKQIAVLSLCEVVFAEPPKTREKESIDILGVLEESEYAHPRDVPVDIHGHQKRSGTSWRNIAVAMEHTLLPDGDVLNGGHDPLPPASVDSVTSLLFSDHRENGGLRLRIPGEQLHRDAKWVWRFLKMQPDSASFLYGELARSVLGRLFDQDPPGARWETEIMAPCSTCGMGSVTADARVLLKHYAQ